ncbi:MAG: haloacid dehalogenase-like hydrolase [Dysgonamonadaceae bacterium]|jgi:HAD superfamily hydrolase (TIGR01490 family)|nr:haloacid dehalogenase-like hydrolase [Dysgonamonadaceae bacterium]
MRNIAVFDFDGTITQKDTLFEFLKFTHGWRYYINLLILSPVLIAFKLKLIKNYRAKQILFSLFYKEWDIDTFNSFCADFASKIKIRPKALDAIKKHSEKGDIIVIASASIENWIYPWSSEYNIDHVLATRIEVIHGKITGKFFGKNCFGQEKVNRISEVFPTRTNYYLTAYGDSRGDKELLEYANESYLNKF